MTDRARLLILSFDKPLVDRLTAALSRRYRLFHALPQKEALTKALDAAAIDICLFDSDDLAWDAGAHLSLMAEIAARSNAAVVMLAGRMTASSVIEAVRAGARDICDKAAAPDEMMSVIESLLARRAPVAGERPATLIATLGPKGGVGATTTALAIAQAAARRLPEGERLLFIDLGPSPAGILDLVALRPGLAATEAARNIGRLDAAFIEDAIARCDALPLHVLPLARPGEAVDVTPASLRLLLAALQGFFHAIVVDTDWSAAPTLAAEAFRMADHPLLCCSQSVPVVHAAAEALKAIEGKDPLSYHLLVTRHDGRLFPQGEDIAQSLDRKAVPILIPEDRVFVETARNMAAPLIRPLPLTAFEAAVDRLAGTLLPGLAPAPCAGLLHRLARRVLAPSAPKAAPATGAPAPIRWVAP